MKSMRGMLLAASLPLLWSCGSPAAFSSDPIGSTASPIEGGETINQQDDPVSSLFPLSTVQLTTPRPDASGHIQLYPCTGVILSPTRILTAAHCKANSGTLVYLYPTGGGASLPNPNSVMLAAADPIVPADVVCDPDATDWSDCYSNTPTRHFADLAVLPLRTPIPPPYRRVILGPRGSYAAGRAASAWTVGAGMMNLSAWAQCDVHTPQVPVQNETRHMEWVASTLLSASDGDGSFKTARPYTDPGDSGGPLYQRLGADMPIGADGYYLTLVGITSGGNCGASGSDIFTSTVQPDNYDWLVSQGGSAAPLVTVAEPGDDAGPPLPDPTGTGITGDAGGRSPSGAGDSNGEEPTGTGLITARGSGCGVAPGEHTDRAFAPLAALALLGVRRRRACRDARG